MQGGAVEKRPKDKRTRNGLPIIQLVSLHAQPAVAEHPGITVVAQARERLKVPGHIIFGIPAYPTQLGQHQLSRPDYRTEREQKGTRNQESVTSLVKETKDSLT